jgi:hypothetical protein
MARLPEFMKNMGSTKNNELLINQITEVINQARAEIEEQAKYYNLQWKIDMLTALKKEAIDLYNKAIEEANAINNDYERRIRELEATQYEGARVNKDEAAILDFEFRSLKAELNMTNDKEKVIDKYLASKIGAKAVLMLFADKDIDLGHQAQNIYTRAYMKSKTQAELDFEIKKQEKINQLKLEQAEKVNIGKLLAAQRIMQGNPEKGIPSLENMFDEEIRQLQRMMANEREAIKDEVRRELMREGKINE